MLTVLLEIDLECTLKSSTVLIGTDFLDQISWPRPWCGSQYRITWSGPLYFTIFSDWYSISTTDFPDRTKKFGPKFSTTDLTKKSGPKIYFTRQTGPK